MQATAGLSLYIQYKYRTAPVWLIKGLIALSIDSLLAKYAPFNILRKSSSLNMFYMCAFQSSKSSIDCTLQAIKYEITLINNWYVNISLGRVGTTRWNRISRKYCELFDRKANYLKQWYIDIYRYRKWFSVKLILFQYFWPFT